MYCLLVVLVKFQYLPSDWLERLLRGSLTVARGLSLKSPVCMILLVYSIVLLCNCMVELFPCPSDIHCTSIARYSLFVLKVPLNNNKPNQTCKAMAYLSFEMGLVVAYISSCARMLHENEPVPVLYLHETRRLAAADRSCISIRGRQFYKNFPHI